jgi:hypothetical protein
MIVSGVGIGLGVTAAIVNAGCGVKQHFIIRNSVSEVQKLLRAYFEQNNIPYNIMPQQPSDGVLAKEGAIVLMTPAAKAAKVALGAITKGALYTLDDVGDDILGALPKITSGVSRVGGAALSFGFIGLGVALCSIDTGLIINQMNEHSKKNELPSKQIRELILILDNSSLDELKEQGQSSQRSVTVTVKNDGWFVAFFYVKYYINKQPIEDLTRMSGLKITQTKKLTFFLPNNAENPTIFIKSYRGIRWVHTILERKIDNLPYSGVFTLSGTSLREKIEEIK